MEYKKLIWLAWYAYFQNNLVDMTKYLELSLDHTPLSRMETVLHWIQSFAQLSTSVSEEFNYNYLVQEDEWQKSIKNIALKKLQPKLTRILDSNEKTNLSPNNYQDSISKFKNRKAQQKYQRILSSFSEEFKAKKRVLCLMFKMSEEEIIEAILTIECKIKQKDILAIIITDHVNINLFAKEQMIAEYFPLNDTKINNLSSEMWNKYFSVRVSSLFYEWSPHTVLNLKSTIEKNILVYI